MRRLLLLLLQKLGDGVFHFFAPHLAPGPGRHQLKEGVDLILEAPVAASTRPRQALIGAVHG